MRILVRVPNWIGDQIMTYPFFHALRAANPRAHIAAACPLSVASLQFRNLVDEVLELPQPPGAGADLRDRFEALEAAALRVRRAGPWDLGFSLPNSFSSAWLLRRAGVRRRRGYSGDGRGWLLNPALPRDANPELHRAQSYVNLLSVEAVPAWRAVEFWGAPSDNELDPRERGVVAEFDFGRAWPDAISKATEPPGRPYYVLAPGSNAESRRWPIQSFEALARRIRRESGLDGVVVGGPAEAPLAARLCADESLGLVNRTAVGSVAGLAPLFRGSEFVVANDSGLAHAASLCGAFVQVVWGAGEPRRTRPIGPGRVQVALNPVACWPCEKNDCRLPPERRLECLRGVREEEVWSEIQRGLRLERSQRSLERLGRSASSPMREKSND